MNSVLNLELFVAEISRKYSLEYHIFSLIPINKQQENFQKTLQAFNISYIKGHFYPNIDFNNYNQQNNRRNKNRVIFIELLSIKNNTKIRLR